MSRDIYGGNAGSNPVEESFGASTPHHDPEYPDKNDSGNPGYGRNHGRGDINCECDSNHSLTKAI
jgi:hypothetical protein